MRRTTVYASFWTSESGPAPITVEQVEQVVIATLDSTPANATHWSRTKMADIMMRDVALFLLALTFARLATAFPARLVSERIGIT